MRRASNPLSIRLVVAAGWLVVAAGWLVVAAGCGEATYEGHPTALATGPELIAAPQTEAMGNCRDFDELRRPYFGDTHVHTSYSLDANLQGTRQSPRDAYRFAMGEPIGIQPYDENGEPERYVQIDRPLDWAVVTDHAEFMGFIAVCEDPAYGRFRRYGCRSYRNTHEVAFLLLNSRLADMGRHLSPPRVCGGDNEYCFDAMYDMWIDIQNVAEDFYDRSDACGFTTFVGYEWTGTASVGLYAEVLNLHRNVIFRNNIVPHVPTDHFAAEFAPDLWQALREDCLDGLPGCDVLTIPHNANLSGGRMFSERLPDGSPMTLEYALERQRMEPLIEIYQHKGASECLPGGSNADELCDFENLPYLGLGAAKLDELDVPRHRDFLRTAYGSGMRLEQELGANPFAFGIVAATDNHLGMAGGVHEALFAGGGGAGESRRKGEPVIFPDRLYFGAGGLSVAWAEENSREAIFEAMMRRETYGTSGPRMIVRTFAGWDLPSNWCDLDDRARVGYESGVPMGGTLPPNLDPDARPSFAISARYDPGTSELPGAPLQRLQVVKGWLDDEGEYRVEVFDVAGHAGTGHDLDIATCQPGTGGFEAACTTFTDPSFSPQQSAYYYVRAVEVPTCRWTTRICVEQGYDCDDPTEQIDRVCCGPNMGLHEPYCVGEICNQERFEANDPCCQLSAIAPLVQERAWTSPIWYRPEQ